MAEINSVIDNKYRILDQVGKGGMSAVYLARDKRLEKLWAVKEILNLNDPKKRKILVDSLKSEARLMKDLDHPAVVRIVDIIDEKSSLFVVMDYIDGRDLTSYLYPNGKKNLPVPIEQEQAVEWGIQICDVLRYLHAQNPPIIYYDLKPDNVMIRNEGDVRLIDFGAARKYSTDPDIMNKYKILGTMGYAAPEQYKGGAATDVRTDIYTFGMTLHFMVTGQAPKANKQNKNPRARPIREINPRLSSGLERIINKCTQPNPADRYQSCEELMYALEHYHELDDQYKAKQKKTLKTFAVTAGISIGLLLFSGIFAIANSLITQSNYNALINVGGSTEQQVASAYEAIEIDNSQTGAYDKLLTLYEAAGQITTEQADELDAKINASTIKDNDLWYRIGCDYLFYLVDNGGQYGLNASVQRALPYFSNLHEQMDKSYENYDKAEAMYTFCDFYNRFVSNGNAVEEAGKEDYDNLLSSANEAANLLEEETGVESGNSGYVKLQFFSGMLGIINEKLSGMHQTGVDKASIEGAVNNIKSKVEAVEVTLEKSSKLKETIIDTANTIIAQTEALYSSK